MFSGIGSDATRVSLSVAYFQEPFGICVGLLTPVTDRTFRNFATSEIGDSGRAQAKGYTCPSLASGLGRNSERA